MSKFLLDRCLRELSPLTVLKDDIQQTAKPLLHFMIQSAASRNIKVLFVSYETLEANCPSEINQFIYATSWNKMKSLKELYDEIVQWWKPEDQHLIVIDAINPILNNSVSSFSMFFGSILALGSTAFLTAYHKDVSLENYPSYLPACETFLDYTSTCTVSFTGMQHLMVEHDARMRSQPNPLTEELQDCSIVNLLGSNCENGIVCYVDFRKKSGRVIKETCTLKNGALEVFTPFVGAQKEAELEAPADLDVPFNLTLSEKERNEREEVFLPHFGAQDIRKSAEPGFVDGGAIIYHADKADDFDEEEDADEDLLI
ncbi:elongator complex subunit Iki1 [Schizosaccharomyces cryophilus OY26]|uniref:Elongator complex protein 5 n=1 Tax=Schizosaccharomyces cryophilus (strain OY26 / ATCC MYA-4695 / CBS 11777 / NBRC 106824 / NRRL Y48691) TaxID=653667 RepID=S9WY09_SCHCR|nr:elongator complex subunit Iki1 [Schizosaccharomyces cryophilus OY26]EPY49617.1 elongator complex subunit Iki1 [Schizosaccharomyces cryophilus OY26]